MELTPDSRLHGFIVQAGEKLPEIDGDAYVLKHEKSGARLLYLRNDDPNKAFSISFRTPPKDDTGVFHILEHSVLNGSRKFPVKEPFVNLLKTSMQTFLNALTFTDKTMYPVASTNEQDLMNLMDVYLDAVLHPSIYQERTVFEQEGWHYELAEGNEDSGTAVLGDPTEEDASAGTQGKLRCNGVVYNEMKGALSDASSVLFDQLQAALFPSNSYRYESGGDPASIPTLTYEAYLDEHRRHYRLDNSYLVLYGNLSIDTVLAFLDERYLSPVADEQAADRAARMEEAGARTNELEARKLTLQEPVCNLRIVRTMDTAPENACMGLAFVVGTAHDRKRVMAVDILLDAVMGSNEAPLKRALLDAHIAGEATGSLAEAALQPFAIIEVKGLQEDGAQRFRPLVMEELERLADGGLDHALVEASLSRYEFIMRECEYGMSDGVALAIQALSGWLYDDADATRYLRYEDDFAELRAALDSDYFENLIREVFLDNPHQAEVEVRPQTTEGPSPEALRLAKLEAGMDKADFDRIRENVAELRRKQAEPDSPEALATLPRLLRSDVQEAPHEPAYGIDESAPVPCIRHEVPTRGIAYAYRYFDLAGIPFEELPYVTVLASVLGKLGTSRHSAPELDTLVNGKLGNLSFFTDVHEDNDDPQKLRVQFVVSASALSKNLDQLADLPYEIMTETDFSDRAKIKDILTQRRIGMEQSFAQAGHSAAMARLSSYYKPAGVLREQLGGVEFYRFLKRMLLQFDESAEALGEHLAVLAKSIFSNGCLTLSFAGSDDDYHAFWNHCTPLPDTPASGGALVIPQPMIRNEAFIVPTDVCYAAKGFDRRALPQAAPYTAAWQAGARAVTYDFLWNEVRVRGGAYGVGFQTSRIGDLRFYSYRDPHLDETLARFDASAQWLEGFHPTPDVLDGYVVSTVAGFDNPLKARALMRRQDGAFFCGRTPDQRLEARRQMLSTQQPDLETLAHAIRLANAQDARCAFGSKEIIQHAKADFQCVDLLNE